jgi:hypothetical protein
MIDDYNEYFVNEFQAISLTYDDEDAEFLESTMMRRLILSLEKIGFYFVNEEHEKSSKKFIVASLLDEIKSKKAMVDDLLEDIMIVQRQQKGSVGKNDEIKNEGLAKSTTKKEEDPLQKKKNEMIEDIKKRIEDLHTDKGWKYSFKNETDYENFTQLLADYFTGYLQIDKINLLQKGSIRLQPNCKTMLATVLKELRNYHGKGKLKKDEGFLNLLRTLDQYNEAPDLFKMISR